MVVCSTHTVKHCSKGVNIPEAWLHSMAGGLRVTANNTDQIMQRYYAHTNIGGGELTVKKIKHALVYIHVVALTSW